jgi:hypothetical protein
MGKEWIKRLYREEHAVMIQHHVAARIRSIAETEMTSRQTRM